MTRTLKNNTTPLCDCLDKGILCGIKEETRDSIFSMKITNQFKKGHILFHQGSPAFGVHIVTSGKIKLTKTGNDGKVVIIKIAGPGDVLGHTNLFSNENVTATATIIEEAVICFIERKFLMKKMEEDPMISVNIIKKLSDDMISFESRSAAMSHKNVKERLAELLLMLKDTYGVTEHGRMRLDIKLTREEMASMVGTANETVIRFITEFKEAGILEQVGKVIYITNEEKLKETANVLRC
jgi:CRP-like cAMP-binding protein